MSKIDVVRAWKDENYRAGLSDFERSQLPDNPAGLIELSETDLHNVGGALITEVFCWSFIACPPITASVTNELTDCPPPNTVFFICPAE